MNRVQPKTKVKMATNKTKTLYDYFSPEKRLSAAQICLPIMVGCFGFNGPFRQYFSLYRAVSQREGERVDESKNVQTTPTRTYCKRNRPLPYFNQNCRTPRHLPIIDWLVGCFGFNGPLRQYFSLYRAVSQREGERGEKG